jgi:REP element-mobilizing transposase RayT
MKETGSTFELTFHAWVVMPDHAHFLIQLNSEHKIGKVIQHLKGYSAYVLNKESITYGKFWQENYYEYALRGEESIKEISRYIIMNPLRAGLVKSIRYYSHWDSIYV